MDAQWRVVEVAVPVPVDETYTYRLPPGLDAQPGARVLVPYRGREVTGVVLGVRETPLRPPRGRLRPVSRVVDAEPVLSPTLLRVVLRAAEEALAPPGVAVAAAVPPGTAPRPGRRIELLEPGRRALDRGELRGRLGRLLWSLGRGPLSEERLQRRFPEAVPVLNRLERLGWIQREAATEPARVRVRLRRRYHLTTDTPLEQLRARLARAPRQLEICERLAAGPEALASSSALRALVRAGFVRVEEEEITRGEALLPPLRPEPAPPELTGAQQEAVTAIVDALLARRDLPFLLHGITGSGKTEVYLRAAQAALHAGRGVIVLVPEISLTHQVVDRFRARFGNTVAVLHSGLSGGERFDQWRRIHDGTYTIAIGARSAVFAPIEDLGLIVIDEEHDPAYKSEEGFRYHARDVARLRAQAARCPLVLGSATPDVETTWHTEQGEIQRLVLPKRVTQRPLPTVEIVDMNREQQRRGRRLRLSRTLRHALAETLAAGQQAILFLNRRGFATLAYCFACGHGIRCQHCDIALVYHATEGPRRPERPEQGDLRCHYCGFAAEPPSLCPACGSVEGGLLGYGTERIHEEIAAMFPHARVARLDRDTSARKGAQRAILGGFHRGEVDVLVGTQMVAKGHDVPGVTLVGVIAADLGLHFPDFRAGERTFQLLTQVAGRAGRGHEPGRVVIQTFLPEHYAIACARTHAYGDFYREELRRRRPHGYPPFRSLVRVLLSGLDAGAVESAARALGASADSVPVTDPDERGIEVLGPAPAPLARIRDRYRWQLLVLGAADTVHEVAHELERQARGRFRGVQLRFEVSPLQML